MRLTPRALWRCSVWLSVGVSSLCSIAQAATLAAWVELVGPGPEASVRVITTDASCPQIRFDDSARPMRVRAKPGPLFADDSSVPAADFASIQVCEADAPAGKTSVDVGGRIL